MASSTPDVQDPAREDGRSTSRSPDAPAQASDGITGVPDSPGPTDVSDDKVIERTLPTVPANRDGSPSS